MVEQAVFTTKAHVFQIDPDTKRSWLPVSKLAIPVSFYFDPTKESYRIISVDGAKAVINSMVSGAMTFTKTSQKFGQWSDPKNNTVFGLGFTSEADLNKFAEKFKEAKESAKTATQPSSTPPSSTPNTKSPHQNLTNSTGKSVSYPEVNGVSTHLSTGSTRSFSSSGSNEDETTGSHKSISSTTDSQLKYENDRLKKALAQSSANAKKWEAELQTLKNNNAKLTAALQESTMNVEKWREQLNNYKEENSKLKRKAMELEGSSSNSNATVGALEKGKHDLEQRVQELESRLKRKDEELAIVTQNSSEMTTLREKNADLNNKVQQLQTDNRRFVQTNLQLEQKLKEAKGAESKLKELKDLETTMQHKLNELVELQQKMSSTLQL